MMDMMVVGRVGVEAKGRRAKVRGRAGRKECRQWEC